MDNTTALREIALKHILPRSRLVRKKVCTCHLGADFPPSKSSDLSAHLNFQHLDLNDPRLPLQHPPPPQAQALEWMPAPPPRPPPRWASERHQLKKFRDPSREERVDVRQGSSPRNWQGIEELLLDTCKRWASDLLRTLSLKKKDTACMGVVLGRLQ